MKGWRTTLKALTPNPCMIFIMIWDQRFLFFTRFDLSAVGMLSDNFLLLFIAYLNGLWHKSFVFEEISQIHKKDATKNKKININNLVYFYL